jgi:hypothetical protein
MLGIKSNIEMFYLPDEMFRQRHQKIHVTIGKPIPWSRFDKSKSHAEWAEEIKKPFMPAFEVLKLLISPCPAICRRQ